MEIPFTPDQKAFVNQAIATGRIYSVEDAAKEAFALWEDRERERARILAAVDTAVTSLAEGKGRVITEQSMKLLAEEVRQRALARREAKGKNQL